MKVSPRLRVFLISALISGLIIFIINKKNYSTVPKNVLSNSKAENFTEPNLLCIVFSSVKTLEERMVSVMKSWAHRCNKTLIVCNCTNAALTNDENKAYFPSGIFLELDFVENYDFMALKMMLTLREVYKKYGKVYNYFLITDDDTFIFTRNLFKFLRSKDPKQPLTYGYNFKTDFDPNYYQSGGGGTVVTQESLRLMYERILKKGCNYREGYGDVALGLCAKEVGVKVGNSTDSKGRERFHALDSVSHYFDNMPDWMIERSHNGIRKRDDCCSDESISFHYVAPEHMEVLAFFNKYN